MKLYHMQESGNCYKIRLLLHLIDVSVELIPIDILSGGSRTDEFLKKNSNGRVPLLEVSDSQYLAESNAILFFLAKNTAYLPTDDWQQAQVLQWMFFEQYSHEPFIATVRYWIALLNARTQYKDQIEAKRAPGYAALDVMDQHLQQQSFMVGDSYSVADIALYAYTHVAHEGDYNLDPYSGINCWLQRIRQHPGHITIDQQIA